jgi:hypothetical protein
MQLRTKDKIYSLLWNMDKYIKQTKKNGRVNNKPIYPHDLVEANKHRAYVSRLYKDIRKIGYKNYRITREELLELNTMYTKYKIDLSIYPQYEPPRIRRLDG